MKFRRSLAVIVFVGTVATGFVAASASGASASVADWTTSAPSCVNTTDGGWWDFSSLAPGLICYPGITKVFSATSASSSVYLDQTISRWTYANGWRSQTVSSVRYSAQCGYVNLATFNWDNKDCSAVGHSDTWWHGAESCNTEYVLPFCGNVDVNADDLSFSVMPGEVVQVQKTAWWLSGGRWVAKTATFLINDSGVVIYTQFS